MAVPENHRGRASGMVGPDEADSDQSAPDETASDSFPDEATSDDFGAAESGSGVIPAHPGVVPPDPGVVPAHPGVVPAHPGVAPEVDDEEGSLDATGLAMREAMEEAGVKPDEE